ncbi:MAG: UDP-3-O-(3-hydroxymyristoyl)glucosamine N-acyltransferase [Bdellovibrionaceae bacterium]|nr:UDP-3-O-(3-hydroxymyristoyl)glucosamine N-acyltransferase [Pseudobdellovibrionaceae bacterium]
MVSAKALKELNLPHLKYLQGPLEHEAHGAKPPNLATDGSLVFVSNQEQLAHAIEKNPAILIVLNKLPLDTIPARFCVFTCPDIKMAMSVILPYFDNFETVWDQDPKISPMAYVHPLARLGPGVIIQPFAWIGPHVILGANCRIGVGTVIQDRSLVGQGTTIHPQVFVAADTEIGIDCEIHPHTSIGSPGFGFASTSTFRHHKIPQIGRVVLGDRVRIGSNCNIDRATLLETRIGSGTKIDAHCHIAHNCEVGEDGLIAAGFFTAGSTRIGHRFVTGGGSVTADHLLITDDVMLAGRSTVTNDILEKGQYGGYPLQPLKDSLRTLASLPHLVQLRKHFAKLVKNSE